jgi:predicted transcriptional regulator
MPDNQTPSENSSGWNFRQILAGSIAGFVILGSIALGIVGIWFAMRMANQGGQNQEGMQVLQYIFGALLPLWGTWIGTILAYYFSKENFESANKNVREMVSKMTADEKLGKLLVTDAMIPYQNFSGSSLIAESMDKLKSEKLDDMIGRMNNLQRQRLPVIVGQKVIHVFHKSTLLEFRFDQGSKTGLLYSDMNTVGNQWIKDVMQKGIKYLGRQANLLEAKQLMESETACNDVVVTSNGTADGDVVGWITDKILNEKSKV